MFSDVEFEVGPAKGLPDEFVTLAAEAWHRFVEAVPDHPFPTDAGPAFAALHLRGNGVAESTAFMEPEWPGDRAELVLSRTFFDWRSEDQTLTLLHECLHLSTLFGPLRWRHRECRAIFDSDKAWKRRCESADAHNTWLLGMLLWQVPEEVLVERVLQAEFDRFGSARADQLARMRLDRGDSLLDRCPAAVLEYGVLFEICGMRLALELPTSDLNLRANCESRLAVLEARGRAYGAARWDGLKLLADQLFDVDAEHRAIRGDAGVALRSTLHDRAKALCGQAAPQA